MEWFRWYAGTFSDPKFQWVAVKTCNTVASVLAVWVAVLERANSNEIRGCCGGLDFESLDVALGLEDGAALDIYQALIRKGMIVDDDMVAAWDKRQPKREDETAVERKRDQRERDKLRKENEQLRLQIEAAQSQESQTVTNGHAMSHDVTTEERRLEEKREEESKSSSPLEEMPTKALSPPEQTATRMTITDIRFLHHESFGTNMPGGCAFIATQICQEFTALAIREAFKTAAEHGRPTMAYVRGVLKGNGKGKPARASPPGPVSFERAKSERTKLAAQAFVERKRAECQTTTTSFSGQSSPDLPRLLGSSAVSSE